MRFEEAARGAGRAALAAAETVPRPGLTRLRVRRMRRRVLVTALAGALVVLGVVALRPADTTAILVGGDTTTTPATTRPMSTTTQPEPLDFDLWTLTYPATWHRGSSEMMPALGWDSVTVANFPLRPGGLGCAQFPVNALQDLAPSDALLTIFFTRAIAGSDASPWPVGGFNDSVFSESGPTEIQDCAGRPGLEVHWGQWSYEGEGLYLLAAFGDEVPAATRDELWGILSSLSRQNQGTGPGVCVATEPPVPGLEVPDAYPEQPPFGVWYGTTDLWTVLEERGRYGTRKSVWWSGSYAGQAEPAIHVTWRRLDGAQPPLVSGRTTGGYEPASGWFMIAGIDPDQAGCWEITATYEGATLSYVASIS